MKTEKWMSAAVLSAALLLLGATSCGPDWGDVDPPAGNQTYPTLEMVASYAFDSEEELDPIVINLQPYDGAEQPTLIEDDMVESNVLDLSNGYARFNNPLAEASVQNAVSLTFWMKQISAPALDEEGNVIEGEYQPQDLVSPIFHWENENATSTLDFSANGWWNYDGVDGEWSANDPAEYATGYITPNEWHYVALTLRNDGYAIYVDGQKKVDQPVVDFDVTKAVQLAHNSDYLYVNYGADTHTSLLIEDLSFYRNVIESKQISMPKKGKFSNTGGGGSIVFDPRKYFTVGLEDCTTPWWTPELFSPVIPLTGDGTVHFGFYNYNNGTTNNWCNWLLVATHGAKAFGEDGYGEYFVLRSDAWGWGEKYSDDAISHEFDWETYCAEMDGAWVDMTITRTGETVKMTAIETMSTGVTRTYTFTTSGYTEPTIGFFLLCEGSCLKVDLQEVLINGKVYPENGCPVGLQDCTTPWWTPEYFSPLIQFDRSIGLPLTFTFYNYNNGTTNNWCNWLLVATNGKSFGEDGYYEYFVLRSDAYGWGANYNGDNISHTFDWETYCADMDGAYVRLFVDYDGDAISMTAKIIKNDGTATGTALGDYKFKTTGGIPEPVSFFLLCEGSYLDVRSIGYAPLWKNAN